MLSIRQAIETMREYPGTFTISENEARQICEWLQELLSLREQIKTLKKRFPSLVDAQPQANAELDPENLLARVQELEAGRQRLVTEVKGKEVTIETLKAECDQYDVQIDRLAGEKSALQHVLKDREAKIKGKEASIETLSRHYAVLKQSHEGLCAERDKLHHMLETANADRRALSEEIERLGRVCELATTRKLTPFQQVFQQQIEHRGVKLCDEQVIILTWLLENTPNEFQRTAYLCNSCDTPMVSLGFERLANRCQCPNGVSRTTLGLF